MRLAKYQVDGTTGWGVVNGDIIAPVSDWPSLRQGIAAGTEMIAASAARTSQHLPLASVTLLPPAEPEGKIFCVGLNYRNHVAETGREYPEHPSVFVRLLDSFVGHSTPVQRPTVSERFDFEGEIAVVIGRSGRHIPAAKAFDHIFGFTCLAENSVRDFQKHTTQVTAGKNFTASGAIGPWIVSADELPGIDAMTITTHLNDEQMQQGQLSDLIYPIPKLIEYISTFTTLNPGRGRQLTQTAALYGCRRRSAHFGVRHRHLAKPRHRRAGRQPVTD
jgi:2-keto-4-pentenoate hydratase/2-oxohepta-3-ene-1,7-dioic acid hydratase in catechol pathway